MTIKEIQAFTREVNKVRLNNKNKWYTWQGVVNGRNIQIKGFDTWLQIANVNGINYANSMYDNVTEFKHHLMTLPTK